MLIKLIKNKTFDYLTGVVSGGLGLYFARLFGHPASSDMIAGYIFGSVVGYYFLRKSWKSD